ncbi:uncharacterized protein LAJ45_06879 [Morchella importuna]|uniref:uncharacterized protein n=1 Tax=Morchella importuna TaxID=1174673 RepID=UPI001E8D6219|nr:uncharacterized protein LAJ45_06879 [Morchella importuna]KAH8148905.1 hypothetical protein LAJ45_06879 [Morchella importuna]
MRHILPARAAPAPPPRPSSPFTFTYTISPTSPLPPAIPTPVANRRPYDQLVDPRTDPNSGIPPIDWEHFPSSPSPSPSLSLSRSPSPPPPPRKRRRSRHTDTSPSRTPIRRHRQPARDQRLGPHLLGVDTSSSSVLQLITFAGSMTRKPTVRPDIMPQPTSPQLPARGITCPRATQAKSAAWGWGWVSMRTPAAAAVLSPTARPVLQLR